MKLPHTTIDGREYWWKEYQYSLNGKFDFLANPEKRYAIEDVTVEHCSSWENGLDYKKNGVEFNYYGNGSIDRIDGVKLDDGTYMVCVALSLFEGTEQEPGKKVKYYNLTHLT